MPNETTNMDKDACFTANLLLLLMVEIKRYKVKHFDKGFKINASGQGMLSERQFHILFIIEYLHVNTLSQISEKLELSGGSLSAVISKLAKNGLLYKKYPDHDDDKRKTYFHVTPEGRRELQQLIEHVTAALAAFYEGLNDSQRRNFLEAYRRLMTFVPDEDARTGENPLSFDNANQMAAKFINGIISASTILQKSFCFNLKAEEKEKLLPVNQFQALFFIDANRINTLRELSKTIGISESALSVSLSKMTAEGLVYKEYPEAEEDGRKISFYITEEGRKNLRKTKKKIISFFVSYYHTLQAKQQENLYEGIKNLYTIFREEPI